MDDKHCYCGTLDPAQLAGTFQCSQCRKRFHSDCLKDPVLSPLKGDTFYSFKCSDCGEENKEEYVRAKMQWQDVVTLTLYNLQLGVGGGGKCGYFRWKDHVCAFIDKHWSVFFGQYGKKKTNTWHGTIAGTLSSGCPLHFTSGAAELGASGWWKLTEMKPPVFHVEPPSKTSRRNRQPQGSEVTTDENFEKNILDYKRPHRRSKPFSLTAASELKARRATVTESSGRKRKTQSLGESTPVAGTSTQDTDATTDPDFTAQPSAKIKPSHKLELLKEALQRSVPPTDLMMHQSHGAEHTPHPKSLVYDATSHLDQSEDRHLSASYLSSQSPSPGEVTLDDDVAASSRVVAQDTLTDEKQEEVEVSSLLMDQDDSDDSLEIDPGSLSPATMDSRLALCKSPDMDELMMNITGDATAREPNDSVASRLPSEQSSKSERDDPDLDAEMDSEGPSEREEEEESEEGEEDEEGDEEEEDDEQGRKATAGKVPVRRRRKIREKRRQEEEEKEEEEEEVPTNLHLMTPYDENIILKQLNSIMSAQPLSSEEEPLPPWKAEQLIQARNRLRRKLIVRKLKRDNGLPVFDLDATMATLAQKYREEQPQYAESDGSDTPASTQPRDFARTLDRYLMPHRGARVVVEHTSFRTRLVGFEDDQLQPITSPYTMRVLKPFIKRDTEIQPLKVKLLQEIIAYPHRNEPSWKAPPPASLDFSYVRPQHIPSVNALCRAFFWPGVDLSECLQYPDFSCVVMYKKVVVAFAFMVPDVKHNEAYISFIFTHPEWRRAGIASFMLYHLIQTCMGKDVTLHVSATNPAALLYLKFGFKAEDLCLDFYDKYFPVDSRECKHAYFMRMR